MKRIVLFMGLVFISTYLNAQGLYFDIGGGIGMTSNDAQIKFDFIDAEGGLFYPRGFGYDISGKVGYGAFNLPLYIVGEASWTKTNNYESKEWDGKYSCEINHTFFGPGMIYYPSNDIQLATSIGMVYTSMKHTIKRNDMGSNQSHYPDDDSGSEIGFGFNLSSAIDFGNDTSGLLVGGKFSYSSVKDLKISDLGRWAGHMYSPSTVYVGIFAKYRFKG